MTLSTEIYPPEAYSSWWWLPLGLCLLGIVGVLIWAWWWLRALSSSQRPEDALRALQDSALQRIDVIESAVAEGAMDSAEAHQRLSAEVRRFVGIATEGDADYLVLPQLRRDALKDPRLDPIVALVARLETPAFAPTSTTPEAEPTPTAMAPIFSDTRAVVEQWR